jgi:Cof subfamily protein (haloacid dehalogenase superfamily)
MIGRAAIGAPWIFNQINHYLETGEELEEPSLEEKMDLAIRHFKKLIEIKPERVATMEMRGHAAFYLKGEKNGKRLKQKIQKVNTKEEMVNVLSKIKNGKIKTLFLFDIDGTILPVGEKEIPTSTKESIEELINNGYEVAIATGKAYQEAKKVGDQLGIKTIISTNGQVVHIDGVKVYDQEMDFDEVNKFVKDNIDKLTIGVQSSERSYAINGPNDEILFDFLEKVSIPKVELFSELQKDIPINQVWLVGDYQNITIPEGYKTAGWPMDVGCDMLIKEASKANGLKKLKELSDKEFIKVFAFGDGLNDIEMLEEADVSIAMGKSKQVVKDAATYVTTNDNDDGIFNFLK